MSSEKTVTVELMEGMSHVYTQIEPPDECVRGGWRRESGDSVGNGETRAALDALYAAQQERMELQRLVNKLKSDPEGYVESIEMDNDNLEAENLRLEGTLNARNAGQIEAEKIIEEQDNQIEQLGAENRRLRDDAAQVFIEELHFEDGSLSARMRTPVGAAIATFIREMIRTGGGQNFLTFQMSFSGEDPVYVTFGKADGSSVDEKYQETAAENARLKEKVAELSGITLGRCRGCGEWITVSMYEGWEGHTVTVADDDGDAMAAPCGPIDFGAES